MLIVLFLARLRASSRDVSRMEPGAAPAGGARNPALGRPRDPIGRHYDPSARSSLHWPRANAGFKKRGPGDRKAAMERREAPALSKRECGKTKDWCAARRSIPSGYLRGKDLSAEARRAKRN